MDDEGLNLQVRQVEPAHIKIVLYQHWEAGVKLPRALLWLMLTGVDIMGPCILPAAITYMLYTDGMLFTQQLSCFI